MSRAVNESRWNSAYANEGPALPYRSLLSVLIPFAHCSDGIYTMMAPIPSGIRRPPADAGAIYQTHRAALSIA